MSGSGHTTLPYPSVSPAKQISLLFELATTRVLGSQTCFAGARHLWVSSGLNSNRGTCSLLDPFFCNILECGAILAQSIPVFS